MSEQPEFFLFNDKQNTIKIHYKDDKNKKWLLNNDKTVKYLNDIIQKFTVDKTKISNESSSLNLIKNSSSFMLNTLLNFQHKNHSLVPDFLTSKDCTNSNLLGKYKKFHQSLNPK